MRKTMAGMGLLSVPLLSLIVGALPHIFLVAALVLGGGNLLANATTVFTTLLALGSVIVSGFPFSPLFAI